ncbi:MAG: hypothetical protein LBI40_02240, partial [Treponema sp.]|nr:hypothetical protein [Treponema sp.]
KIEHRYLSFKYLLTKPIEQLKTPPICLTVALVGAYLGGAGLRFTDAFRFECRRRRVFDERKPVYL